MESTIDFQRDSGVMIRFDNTLTVCWRPLKRTDKPGEENQDLVVREFLTDAAAHTVTKCREALPVLEPPSDLASTLPNQRSGTNSVASGPQFSCILIDLVCH
jgi:hypothetical protein